MLYTTLCDMSMDGVLAGHIIDLAIQQPTLILPHLPHMVPLSAPPPPPPSTLLAGISIKINGNSHRDRELLPSALVVGRLLGGG